PPAGGVAMVERHQSVQFAVVRRQELRLELHLGRGHAGEFGSEDPRLSERRAPGVVDSYPAHAVRREVQALASELAGLLGRARKQLLLDLGIWRRARRQAHHRRVPPERLGFLVEPQLDRAYE